MSSRVKIQVYLACPSQPKPLGIRPNPNQDPVTKRIVSAVGKAFQTERQIAADTGLHIDLLDWAFLLRVRSTAKELNCDYEFIDVPTQKTFDIDERTLNIVLTGRKILNPYEKKLPIPCLRVGTSNLSFSSASTINKEDIKAFYMENQSQSRKEEHSTKSGGGTGLSPLSPDEIYRFDPNQDQRRKSGEENLAKQEMNQISSESVTCPKCKEEFTPVGSMIKPDGSIQCGKCFTRFKK